MPLDRRLIDSVLLSVLVVAPAAAQEIGVRWQHDVETAKATAAQTGRLVLVHVWADNCGPCLALEQNVFNQPGVAGALEAKFVPVKLNANEYPAIAQWYGINRVPTDLVLAPDGQLVGQMISPATPSAYLAELGQVANQYASQSGLAYQAAMDAAPQPKILNPAYENLPISPGVPPQVLGQTNPPAQNAGATNPFVQSVTPPTDRYAMAGTPTAGMSSAANAGTLGPTATAVDQYASPATTPPSTVTNQYATPSQPSSSIAPATTSTTTPASSPSTPALSPATPDARQLPPGAPPLGFDGYCPVSMRSQWKWVAGDPKWGAIHRGRTYWFVGPQEQQQFLANPDHYAPALAGIDPVMAIDHQQSVAGLREHSLDYDNQFYLFSSEATLEQFTANPERYADGVRQAMGLPAGAAVSPSRR